MSIFFVMNYAKKVKADKGSTILSMQELKDAEEAHGKAASEVHKEVKLTGRQKGVLIAFAFTFVVMIVGFIPLADLNEGVANFFDAGAVYAPTVTPSSRAGLPDHRPAHWPVVLRRGFHLVLPHGRPDRYHRWPVREADR